MNVKIGELYENKTQRFLAPSLKGHGQTFTSKFNLDIFKLAYGIHDTLLDGSSDIRNRRPIFILCDKGYLRAKFDSFLIWLKYQPYYIGDYQYDLGANGRKHMIIIEIPEEYNAAWDNFSLGLYSKMYTEEQIKTIFPDKEKYGREIKIFSKDPQYLDIFVGKVQEEFNVRISDKIHFIDSEYEFPYSIEKEKEIFNYSK